ncbi:ABC1 kinase family protein [Rhizobium straminoryzae]|uniref:AarF/ABC1/UbiB kinase family protein n=1 Tax=Rhizobium straminoryzae TaxID=1387186 RepID=A0A549SPK1_9HYPH|nr:AarF/ABC1/UbiB kinase family protein [Rhizobium straminoryzae]TRL31507.1 AarF/ABC1/UbiB kinase family protein [Rhizobium straminoryzae]
MSDRDRYRPVPQGRLNRLAALGQIAGGVASGVVSEGLSRLAKGERPHLRDLLLTPSNARKAADQLSRMRGAAMKLGQMVSLDPGEFLPPELQAIFSQLRSSAHFMSPGQLSASLASAWGPDWRRHFSRFDVTPMAAASIGQVHRAVLISGRSLAVKVQYPGVARSIDSDIDNVATFLRLSGLVPAGLDLAQHLAEARRQLHEEADYLREAEQMRRFRALLAGDARFVVPAPVEELLRPTVLPMDFVEGVPIERLAAVPEATRETAMRALADLALSELFTLGVMQTDPNFGNYLWRPEDGRIALLDFGAVRPVMPDSAESYRRLLQAILSGRNETVRAAFLDMGYLSSAQVARHGRMLDEMMSTVLEYVLQAPEGLVDFSDRGPLVAVRERSQSLFADRSLWTLPSPDKMFLQRKITGMALLALKLRVRLPVVEMLSRHA